MTCSKQQQKRLQRHTSSHNAMIEYFKNIEIIEQLYSTYKYIEQITILNKLTCAGRHLACTASCSNTCSASFSRTSSFFEVKNSTLDKFAHF